MPESVIRVPKGVVKITSDGNQSARFMSLATQRRLESECAYRKERLKVLSARQRNRRYSKIFEEAAREAENQLQLYSVIFAKLARQENEWQNQPATGNNTTSIERERARTEAIEVLRTIL